jgi:hypothetical protein
MYFVTAAQSQAFFAKLGIDRHGLVSGSRSALRHKTVDVFYDSPLRAAPAVAAALVASQGTFSTCLVWAHGLISGDRSSEHDPPPGWAEYRGWRNASGEPRSLHEAPGHVFDAGETAPLADVIAWAILMGWDALLGAKPARSVVHLSHDDRITISSRTTPVRLIARLEKLGLPARRRGL